MVVGSLYRTSLMGLCLNGKHPRLRPSRQSKPAERAGRFLIVQGKVPPDTWNVNGTPVLGLRRSPLRLSRLDTSLNPYLPWQGLTVPV